MTTRGVLIQSRGTHGAMILGSVKQVLHIGFLFDFNLHRSPFRDVCHELLLRVVWVQQVIYSLDIDLIATHLDFYLVTLDILKPQLFLL